MAKSLKAGLPKPWHHAWAQGLCEHQLNPHRVYAIAGAGLHRQFPVQMALAYDSHIV